MEETKLLARKHGVVHKIDPLELEMDHEKWLTVLRRLDSLDFPPPVTVTDVRAVDPHKYYDGWQLKKKVVEGLHSDYDFAPVEEELARMKDRPGTIFRTDMTDHTVPPNNRGRDLLVHVVDASWENTEVGAAVHLYTRDVDSAHTSLVVVPFHDYFYVKLSDKVTAGVVMKAVRGYDWYLSNRLYTSDEERRALEDEYLRRGEKYDPPPPVREEEKPLIPLKTTIVNMEVVRNLKSVYGYQPHTQVFLKVTTVSPSVSNAIFNSLSRKNPTWEFFEVKTDYINKFFTKHKLSACVAMRVRHCHPKASNHISTCDRLVQTSENFIALEEDAPLYVPRMLYYDIECLSLDPDKFPTPDSCPVIQISVLLSLGLEEVERMVLCLRDTPGSTIYKSFETEQQLLIRFAQIIHEWNPDVVAGFNSNNFDMPYIMDRMEALGIAEFAAKFSRRKGLQCGYKRTFKQSKQFGTKEVIKYHIPGRLMFDLFEVIKADVTKRLRSYSLKSICATYLGDDNKEDLRYRDIPILFETAEGRSKIASYCMKDTALLLELDRKLMMGNNTWALVRVLGVTPDVAVNRGLVHKLMCKLKQYTERFNLLIPTFTDDQKPKFEGKYQGAFVLEPDVGFHQDPVVCLDYASLYPSLMIYYNLSYDSFVTDKAWMEANPDKWEMMDGGACFVKPDVYFGIIPLLEQELGKQRKAAKKKKAQATDPLEKAVWDGEQLAVKVIMNSLYGMLGSPTATVPCVEIAASITAMGRHNLMAAKAYVEKNYCRLTGESTDRPAKVIYGDSVLPNTPLVVRHGDQVEVWNVRDVCDKFGVGTWRPVQDPGREGKESLELCLGLETWTEAGWTPMRRAIRHLCNKKMVTVRTGRAAITCTEDHSLVTRGGQAVSPGDCTVGETALLARPVDLGATAAVTSELTPEVAYVIGMFIAHGDCGEEEDDRGSRYWWQVRAIASPLEVQEAFPMFNFRVRDGNLVTLEGVVGDDFTVPGFVFWWRDMCYYDNGEKRIPPLVINGGADVRQAFVEGMGASAFTVKGRRIAASVSLMLGGEFLESVVGEEVFHFRMGKYGGADPDVVRSVIPYVHLGYVYDFTTENHHFQAGVGPLVVHNTDSIFIKMPGVTTAQAIEHGKHLEKNITKDLYSNKNALVMEYEKTFNPFLLVTAKRYAGVKYEFDDQKSSVTVNGLQLVKRDSAKLCTDVMQGFFDRVFKEKDNEAAALYVEKSIAKLYSDDTPLDFFVLTKKLSKKIEEYDVVPPHIAAWQRMVRRVGRTEAPSIGERFEYIITRVKKGQKGLGDSMVDYELAKEQNLVTSVDKDHYFRIAIEKPLREPMNLVLGKERTDIILNPANYRRTETIVPKKGNILAALGIGPVTTSKRKFGGNTAPATKKPKKK
jgi:DNA polymerase elongation subunit (family B)